MTDLVLRCNDLALELAAAVESQHPDLELMAPPSLSVVCFRYKPHATEPLTPDQVDRLERRLGAMPLGASGEAHMPSQQNCRTQ